MGSIERQVALEVKAMTRREVITNEKHQVKVSYNWLRLMLQEAGVVDREPARGKYRRRRERPANGRHAGASGRLHP